MGLTGDTEGVSVSDLSKTCQKSNRPAYWSKRKVLGMSQKYIVQAALSYDAVQKLNEISQKEKKDKSRIIEELIMKLSKRGKNR